MSSSGRTRTALVLAGGALAAGAVLFACRAPPDPAVGRAALAAVSPTVGYPSSAAQALGTEDVSKWACPVTGANCTGIVPRFNWVLALADRESQAGWQADSNWPRAAAEISTTQLRLNYILALQWSRDRGEWVMDGTSSVVPPAGRTIGFVAGCDGKPGFCTRKSPVDQAVTSMAAAAYTAWDDGVTGQCSPGYWKNQYSVFTYTNLGNAVAPYSTPASGKPQPNLFNPDVTCKTLNGLSRQDGCACRDGAGAPSVDRAVSIANTAGQPCSWSTPDDFQDPSLNNAGQTPHYLLPVYLDAWGDALPGAPAVAAELSRFFVGAGDWQTKFAPASMNTPATQGLGPPAMMFVMSVVGPASRFALYAMNQVILNRGPDGEGQCGAQGGNCWAEAAGEYDFLEAPFWGNGQTKIGTNQAPCGNPPYYIYDQALPMDRLYLTTFNSSGQCNPMVGSPATGGAGSAAYFPTNDMKIDRGAGLAQNTWIYAFVVDASGIQAFRWRADQTPASWPNMPTSSGDVQSRQGKTISSWNGTSVAPASPPPPAQRISAKPPVMAPGAWTPASRATAAQPAGLYVPACQPGSTDQVCKTALGALPGGIDWWGAYASVLSAPDGSFVPGRDTTLNYCVDATAKAQCGAACSLAPASPLGVMYDPGACAGGGVGCNWGSIPACRLCQPASCLQSGVPYVPCTSGAKP